MNAIRLANTVGMSRDEWRRIRRQGIGGSDLPAILGLSPYSTPAEVWAQKVGLYEPEETPAMRRGQALEDAVARLWASEEDRPIRRVQAVLQSRHDPLMLANPDRVATRPEELVEVKTVGVRGLPFWQGEPPAHVMLQVQHYLCVGDWPSGYVVALVAGDLQSWRVERDGRLIEDAWGRARDWWQRYVATGRMPEPTHQDTALLNRLFATSERGAWVELRDEAREWLRTYNDAKAREIAAAEEAERAANLLRAALGEAEEGRLDGQTVVTWKATKRRDIDTRRLREDLPDVAARYERVSQVRRFVVKGDM
jgi:putative phage-type endonuclease